MTQTILSALAVYFVVWWITLFAILPFGVRTQDEENEVTPGTVASAPVRVRGWQIVIWTSLASAVIYGAWYFCAYYLGYGLDSIPPIVPRFDQ
jgi:predicted secreted protein